MSKYNFPVGAKVRKASFSFGEIEHKTARDAHDVMKDYGSKHAPFVHLETQGHNEHRITTMLKDKNGSPDKDSSEVENHDNKSLLHHVMKTFPDHPIFSPTPTHGKISVDGRKGRVSVSVATVVPKKKKIR